MIAYIDMPSGLSGDMFLGCLVDAGWPLDALRATVEKLHLPPELWQVSAEPVMRGPMRALLVQVQAAEGDRHRHLHDIRAMIEGADLPRVVQQRAIAVFTRLAEAEAEVHGSSLEEVHFHEVGALDAIIDIVGVCAGLDALGVEQLYASSAPLGEGWTMSAHGRIPLPAPATLALLTSANAPVRPAPGPGELVTPTGAALLAELAIFRQPAMRLQRIGLGAGRKEFAWPNLARLWLGEEERPASTTLAYAGSEAGAEQDFVQIETNIDDMNPELYAPVRQRLFALGALDVWWTPVQMKKERPGLLLSVLAPAACEDAIAQALLRETTTLGVRVHRVHRHIAERSFASVDTVYGPVAVKLKHLDGQVVGAKPEFEECVKVAALHQVAVRLVYEAAQAAAHEAFVGKSYSFS